MTTEAAPGNCKINYVYLEMVLNKDTKYDVIAGLFKGIIEIEGQRFILLHGLKNATNVLGLDFYNIMTVEVCEGDYKNFMYLTAEKVDQVDALKEVEDNYKILLAAGFGIPNDDQVIDIEKYTSVPKEYKDGKPLNTSTATSGTATGVGNFASPHTRYNQGTTYTKQTTVKADPSPAAIGRTKTKKPLKAALDLMFEKVQQVRAGEYEGELPSIMGADDAGVQTAEEPYDYTAGYGCY